MYLCNGYYYSSYSIMKKNLNVSFLRIASMMLIIVFHSLCFYAGKWWFLHTNIIIQWKILALPTVKIGLSIFFLISGFLFSYLYTEENKYRNTSAFLFQKTRRLLLPYIIWSSVMIGSFKFIPWTDFFIGTAHLWFLMSLFELFVFAILLCRLLILRTNIYIDSIIMVIALISHYAWYNFIGRHYALSIENTLYYLPAFLMGLYCAKYQLYSWCYQKTAAFLFVLCISALTFISYYSFDEDNLSKIDIAIRVISCIAAISALVMTNNIKIPEKCKQLIQNLDSNSMGIYIFNQIIVFIILLIPISRQFLEVHYLIGPFIIFIFSLFIPWGLAELFNRKKFLSWLTGG